MYFYALFKQKYNSKCFHEFDFLNLNNKHNKYFVKLINIYYFITLICYFSLAFCFLLSYKYSFLSTSTSSNMQFLYCIYLHCLGFLNFKRIFWNFFSYKNISLILIFLNICALGKTFFLGGHANRCTFVQNKSYYNR